MVRRDGRSALLTVGGVVLCGVLLAALAAHAPDSAATPPVAPLSAPDGALGEFTKFGSGLDDKVWALAVRGDDTLIVGGDFTQSVGGVANSLKKIGAWDDTWVPLRNGADNGLNHQVLALAVSRDDTVYVGGNFDAANGSPAGTLYKVAAWDDTWIPLGSGANNGLNAGVRALAVSEDDTVYIGGSFTAPVGGAANSLLRVAAWDDTWFAFGAGVNNGLNSTVRAFTIVRDDTVYIGGGFTSATDGTPLTRLATWDDTWGPLGTSGTNGVNSEVSAVTAFRDDTVFVGGGFSSASNGTILNKVGGWRGSWSAFIAGGKTGLNSTVDSLVADDTHGLIYVGGFFDKVQGGVNNSLNYVAAWDTGIGAWIPLTAAGGANGVGGVPLQGMLCVVALALDDTTLYLGGDFTTAGGVTGFGRVAKWTWDAPEGANALTARQGTSVQIAGEGFIGVPTTGAVTLAGQVVSYTRDDSTHITVNVPGSLATGSAPIAVYGVGGWGNVGTIDVTAAPTPTAPPPPAPAMEPRAQVISGVVRTAITPTSAFSLSNFTLVPRYSVYPPLPRGLVVDASTGVISGVPEVVYPTTRHWISAIAGGNAESASSTLDITVTGGPPGSVTSVTAMAGDERAEVSWSPPDDAGGFPITEFEARATPGDLTCQTVSTTCTISDLRNGTTYTIAVRARNMAGWGAWSASSAPVIPTPSPTITIAGSRSTHRSVAKVSGRTTGLVGQQVTPWFHFQEGSTEEGKPCDVSPDGTFTWKRRTPRQIEVYFTHGDVRSNTVIIPMR